MKVLCGNLVYAALTP
ncbi:hypothetical protein OC521_23420 [Vibrio vulnificus]|nr:hypothetical protein [Vibrio vulnificus]MCU8199423.1 hypothetical protein [Vibrio vulnificus]MCU8256328.1 hypothetical protein [Vibrio vulnificus]MCU8300322.1 hypothetical protein [Vibrio vulnificus]MCU8443791.1 hypothetical protein [Vibrio vulnificus]MCU8452855.1 hypothetical protein [Vibrio vulnificus]